jgi:hypothetical protein
MAAAGARAGEAASPPAGDKPTTEFATVGAPYTIRRLGTRPARRNPRVLAIAAATVLLASGGAALALSQPSGQRQGTRTSRATPSATAARPRALPVVSAPVQKAHAAPRMTPGHGPGASTRVVGVGCPSEPGDTVTFSNAPTGPGWTPAGGGWTGNGCDGTALWTMNPNGKQPAPSTLTWKFNAAGATRCTIAVFVPTLNALGTSDYSVSVGPPGTSRIVAAMPVSQSAAAGQWLTLGTFQVSGPSVEVTTAPMPGPPGPGAPGPGHQSAGHQGAGHQGAGHHGAIAASAASALCTR